MGYNFFQIKEVSGAFSKKLDDFRNSLGAIFLLRTAMFLMF